MAGQERTVRGAAKGALKAPGGLQHFVNVAGYFHTSPFLAKNPVFVDQEGASVNAHIFFAIELFQLDDIELLAEGFVLVGDQVEGKCLLFAEVVMGFQAVTLYSENDRVQCIKLVVPIAEILTFSGTSRGVVLGVKIEHHVLAFQAR